MSDYNLDDLMPALTGKPMRRADEDGGDAMEWKIGQAMAEALVSPASERLASYARRLLLADKLFACGSQKLTTDERATIIRASAEAFGQGLPLVAGRIEQFIEREGPYAPKGKGDEAS